MQTYNQEQIDTIKLIEQALVKIVEKYDSDPALTGIKHHRSGCYSINVNGEPKEWFFNEYELGEYLRGIAEDGDN